MPDHELVAIDIALLLPEGANQRAKAANAAMLAARSQGSERLRFDATHLPHITLVQMFVRAASLPALIERIDPIIDSHWRSFPPLVLRVTGVGSSITAAHFVIEPNPSFQALHEELMHAVQPFEEFGGTAEAFYSNGEPPRDGDVAWVARFRAKSSHENFYPHITLGVGQPLEFREPFEFTSDRAAVCRLGRFCSCRVVLREWVRQFPQSG
jgi:2'-5' RNA ligase